jgi:hypothetical protein
MIDEIVERCRRRFEQIEEKGNRCHVPKMIVTPIEDELLVGGTYDRRLPDEYSEDDPISKTLRVIERPFEGVYRTMSFRVGKTTLHISERGVDKNIDALAILYLEIKSK